MKIRTTSKFVRNLSAMGYSVYSCGYCDLQNILGTEDPIMYTAGIYGWNYDVYHVNGVFITTGYRGMIGKSIPHEIIKKYDAVADELCKNCFKDNDYRTKLFENACAFIDEIKKL